MKHSWIETLEIVGWTVLSVALIFIMMQGHATHPKELVSTIQFNSWQMLAYICVIITINSFVVYMVMKNWKKISMTWKIIVGSLLAGAILGSIAMTSVKGLEFVIEYFGGSWKTNTWFNIAAIFAYIGVVVLIRDGVNGAFRKGAVWATAVRINTVVAMLTITYVAAGIAFKLEPIYAIVFLILLAAYDAWAVWVKGSMQEMAIGLVQMGFIPGIGVPKMQTKKKDAALPIAILGGGDIFIIGVVGGSLALAGFGYLPTLGMLAAVVGLFFFAKPKKFYPAVPYILGGLIVAMLVSAVI